MASSWIWQQPDWPQFRWTGSALEPLLEQARAARQELLKRLETLEPPLDREAISTLLGRESLGTAAIEGEQLDPGQVRSSIARRLRLPLAEGQPAASAQVEGLLDVLLEATSTLDEPLTLATLNHWHQRLFAAGPDGLRAIWIGELRDAAPKQVLSGAIGRERLHFEAPPETSLSSSWRPAWLGSPRRPCSWTGWCARAWPTSGFSPSTPMKTATAASPVPSPIGCSPRTAEPRANRR
jgi:Fic family protein